MNTEPRHQCLIYEGSPSKMLPTVAAIIRNRMEQGYRCLYLNSPTMVAGMRSTLSALGVYVESEIARARLILSSEPVSPAGTFNGDFLVSKLEDYLNQAISDGYKGLWASGDMTWEFSPENDFSKLLEYELKLEELFSRRPEICGICQYHRDTLPPDAMRQSLLLHPSLVINETINRINPHYLSSAWPAEESTNRELDQLIISLCAK